MLTAAMPPIIAAARTVALLFFIAFFPPGAGLAGASAFTGLINVSIIVIVYIQVWGRNPGKALIPEQPVANHKQDAGCNSAVHAGRDILPAQALDQQRNVPGRTGPLQHAGVTFRCGSPADFDV
jgi:hypothetical protein